MSDKIDLRGDTEGGLVREVLTLDKLYNLRSNTKELMAVLNEEYIFTFEQARRLLDELELGGM